MAVDMFLKLTDIKGESADAKHKEWIDVLAWHWGATQSGTGHLGGGAGTGKVSVQDLSFTHYVDAASATLFMKCANGAHIKEGTLICRKAGEKPVDYMTVKMHDLIVTSVSHGGSSGEERLSENISLNFAKVEVIYVPQKEDGTPGPKVEAKWDIKKNDKF